MRSIAQWFDLARERSNLSSDRQLAAAIGIKNPSVSLMRRGIVHPAPETMIRVADLAKEPRDVALIELQFCKVTSDDAKAVYRSIAQRLASTAAALALVMVFTASQSTLRTERAPIAGEVRIYTLWNNCGLAVGKVAAPVEAASSPATVAGRWMT